MNIYLIVGIIFIISLILAIRSMKDFGIPKELKVWLNGKRIKGTIVFFKDKIKHYSSSSSSGSPV